MLNTSKNEGKKPLVALPLNNVFEGERLRVEKVIISQIEVYASPVRGMDSGLLSVMLHITAVHHNPAPIALLHLNAFHIKPL